jgi:hypothetical protein
MKNPSTTELRALSHYGKKNLRCFLDNNDWYVWAAEMGLHPNVRKYHGSEFSIPLVLVVDKNGEILEVELTGSIRFTYWKDDPDVMQRALTHKRLHHRLADNFIYRDYKR